jgi:hypothetical protein
MKFAKLIFNREVRFPEFVQFWSGFYNYPLEHLYAERISKSQFTRDDITKLFEWKNGGRLSQKKQNALRGIIEKLDIINKLKSELCLTTFQKEFNHVSAIWKIYLLHLIAPQSYPIFDQHVCRAFYFLKDNQAKEIPSNNVGKEKIYFNEYVKFFNGLSNNKEVSRKKVDEALWAFGKFLKSDYGKVIASPSPNSG